MKASQCGATAYIAPGKPPSSLIYLRTKVGVACGGMMPEGTNGLSAADSAMLAMWISGGAKP